jgi:hypothetical protein
MHRCLLFVFPHKSTASSPPLRRTVAINGLHSTPTGDHPRPLTSRRPHPIKGAPSTAAPRHTSCHPKLRLPVPLTASHRAPTRHRSVHRRRPAPHRPPSPTVGTPGAPFPFPPTAGESPLTGSALSASSGEPFGHRRPWSTVDP